MKKSMYHGIFSVLTGMTLFLVNALALIYQQNFLLTLFDILGISLLFHGFQEANYYLLKSRRVIHRNNACLLFIGGLILLFKPSIPIRFISLIFSFYITIMGLVYFISYCNYKKDQVKGRLKVFVGAVFLFMNGLGLLLNQHFDVTLMIFCVAIYGIFFALNLMIDGILSVMPQSKKNQLKRKLRIPMPMILSIFIPRTMLERINLHFQSELKDVDHQHVDMEVFVHVTKKGMGQVGHVDLYFDDEVLSYGNYDGDSYGLFEAIGDGVLFCVKDKMKYIHFCMKEDKKTIFGYGLSLSATQKQQVQEKIKELKDNAYRWYPHSYQDSSWTKDYASRLYLETQATFYKFKEGRFKTYFVLGTNCVLLADQIIGSAGTDIIDINGIIAPGTYQDYLENEYRRPNGMVVTKTIYHQSS